MTGKNEEKQKPKPRKNRFWIYDPSAFQPLPRAAFFRRHFAAPIRSFGKYSLYTLAFSYPLVLVSLGIIFGGLIFWASLVGSFLLMWLIIKKAGYARNFAEWGVGSRRFLALFGAFGAAVAFVYGLTHLGFLFFPIFFAVVVTSFIIGVRLFSLRN